MKRLSVLTVLAMLLTLLLAAPAQAVSPLRGDTYHTPGVEFDYPYMEAWEGPISGDIDGWIEWWVNVETWTAWPYVLAGEPPPNATHYTMKVKIFDEEGGTLLLETEERGTTTMSNVTWRANGVVTYAHPAFYEGWEGRSVHESGHAVFGPNGPVEGWSTFRLN